MTGATAGTATGTATSTAAGEVYRVEWLPGTDLLQGTCHCGAEHTAQDPVEMWEWLLAHPVGHRTCNTSGKGTM